jgi:hypothetical protein
MSALRPVRFCLSVLAVAALAVVTPIPVTAQTPGPAAPGVNEAKFQAARTQLAEWVKADQEFHRLRNSRGQDVRSGLTVWLVGAVVVYLAGCVLLAREDKFLRRLGKWTAFNALLVGTTSLVLWWGLGQLFLVFPYYPTTISYVAGGLFVISYAGTLILDRSLVRDCV